MNSRELRARRIIADKTVHDMAVAIGKADDSYRKKERGEVDFTKEDIIAIVPLLGLSVEAFNVIFYDSQLPYGTEYLLQGNDSIDCGG